MDTFQFSIPTGEEDVVRKLEFAGDHGFGVEVAAFASGPCLHDPGVRLKVERQLHSALKGFPHPRSYHGAFIDLSLHSADPAVAALTRDRIQRDLETASRLGCTTLVFHTGFNPLVPVRRYEEEFLDRHAAFWPGLAEAWPQMMLCLENMWEPSPELLRRTLRAINHPRVGVCLDVAHAHAYGDFAVEHWITSLNQHIVHMHWNDNHGDTDSHLPIGEGNVPWKRVLAGTRALPRKINVVLELKSLRSVRDSLRHLSAVGLQPTRRLSDSPPGKSARSDCTNNDALKQARRIIRDL